MAQLNIEVSDELLKKLKIHALNENKKLYALANEILIKGIAEREDRNPLLYNTTPHKNFFPE